eukprot:11671316-Heterocapsa_arctica.AAC.1
MRFTARASTAASSASALFANAFPVGAPWAQAEQFNDLFRSARGANTHQVVWTYVHNPRKGLGPNWRRFNGDSEDVLGI